MQLQNSQENNGANNQSNISQMTKEEIRESKAIEEYVEFYRHLREHGNAFGIILCELVFGFILVNTIFNVWSLVIWSITGFFAWIIGTHLEVKRVKDEISQCAQNNHNQASQNQATLGRTV